MEALEFLKIKKFEFAVNAFNKKEVIAFVKYLYKMGVSKVEIDFDEEYLNDDDVEEIYCETMIITFPKLLPRMKNGFDILLAILETRPHEMHNLRSNDVNWKKDKCVTLWWD